MSKKNTPEEQITMPEVAEVPFIGTVVGCTKLNVRKKPNRNADVALVISADTEVVIEKKRSTREWYYVRCEDGTEGYCMKAYIATK